MAKNKNNQINSKSISSTVNKTIKPLKGVQIDNSGEIVEILPISEPIDWEGKHIDIEKAAKYGKYLPSMISLSSYEEQLLKYDDLQKEMETKSNTSIRGPQGQKNSYNGETFDSKWEAAYYIYEKEINMSHIERNHTEYISYIDTDAKMKKFYPDFKVNGQWVEIKGIWREKDLAKKDACPQVTFLDANNIKPLIKELNKKMPNWQDKLIIL